MSKIGYDLDGVLVPDYNQIPKLSLREFYEQTLYAKPLFNPVGDYCIITARDEVYRFVTESWINQLKTAPTNVYMRSGTMESPSEFKYRICIEQGLDCYIESDPHIVETMQYLALKNNVKLKIIHFGTAAVNIS